MSTKPLRMYLLLWLVSLCAWYVPPFVAWQFTEVLPTGIVAVTLVLLGVSGVMTIAWGAILTQRGLWTEVFVSVVVGSVVVIVGFLTPYSFNGEGEVTGGEVLAGMLMPTFFVVGFLLVLGGGIGVLWRRHMTPKMPRVGN